MKHLLSFLLILFGVVVACIAASMILTGPDATGNLFARIVSSIFNTDPVLTGLGNANADSELRFYSAFFFVYGLFVVKVGSNLNEYTNWVPPIIGVFFLGGLARLLSYYLIGEPHIFFQVLLALELLLPPLFFGIWKLAKKK